MIKKFTLTVICPDLTPDEIRSGHRAPSHIAYLYEINDGSEIGGTVECTGDITIPVKELL